MGFAPEVVRRMSLWEFQAAVDGWKAVNAPAEKPDAPDDDEFDRVVKKSQEKAEAKKAEKRGNTQSKTAKAEAPKAKDGNRQVTSSGSRKKRPGDRRSHDPPRSGRRNPSPSKLD